MNLPQDTIIKVGRGGVSNQGNKKKGENRTYFNQETEKLFEKLNKTRTHKTNSNTTKLHKSILFTKKHT